MLSCKNDVFWRQKLHQIVKWNLPKIWTELSYPAGLSCLALCTQLLSKKNPIQNSTLKGISIAVREIIISQLADDMTVFKKKIPSQIPMDIKTMESFQAASGHCLNLKNCELFLIKEYMSHICNIPVKEEVTYLGITVVRNEETRLSNVFKSMTTRDLSLKERIPLMKAEGLSCLTNQLSPLFINKQLCNTICDHWISYCSILFGKIRWIIWKSLILWLIIILLK